LLQEKENKLIADRLRIFSLDEEAKHFENLMSEFNKSTKPVVVNAGIYNAGKSTLFNAIFEQAECFETGDTPTTKKLQTAEYEGICFIDTPGLDAKTTDDIEAFKAYEVADIILFCHNLNTGEYDEKELNFIKKLGDFFQNMEDINKRVVFVGTRMESVSEKESENELKELIKIMRKQIIEIIGLDGFEFVIVSASRFMTGINKHNELLIATSNIKKLRDLIIVKASKLIPEKESSQRAKIENFKSKTIGRLNALKSDSETNIEKIKDKINKRFQIMLSEWDHIVNNINKKWDICRKLFAEYKNF